MGKRMCLNHPLVQGFDNGKYQYCAECLDEEERRTAIEREQEKEERIAEFKERYLEAFGKLPD